MTKRARSGVALILFLAPLGFGCGSAFTGATLDGSPPNAESGADAGGLDDAPSMDAMEAAKDSGHHEADAGSPNDVVQPPDSIVPSSFKCDTATCTSGYYCEKITVTGSCKPIPAACMPGSGDMMTTECACLDTAAEEAGAVKETCSCDEKMPGQFTITCVIKGP
jgi:hypothetical protein